MLASIVWLFIMAHWATRITQSLKEEQTMSKPAEVLIPAHATLGEGALWNADDQALWWLDILENKFHIYDPATDKDDVHELPDHASTVVQRVDGGAMMTMSHGFVRYDLMTRKLEMIAEVETDMPENRFNDGKCDPAGRFWAGTMKLDASEPCGALYCLGIDGVIRKHITGISCSNGIVWSADQKTMYYTDTMTSKIDAFDYDNDTGEIANRRAVITVPEEFGYPDGMTIDTADHLWIALWGGGCVRCYDPKTGKVLDTVETPGAKQTTSCCFGGRDMRTLYITTAQEEMSEEDKPSQPNRGHTFVAEPGATGTLSYKYAG
jgi:sugar lactone lactonase YvrE